MLSVRLICSYLECSISNFIVIFLLFVLYTDKKANQIFLIYEEIQNGAVAKSYMTNGLLIYREIFTYFLIYEEALPHIWLCNCSTLNFLIYEENLIFFSFSVVLWLLSNVVFLFPSWLFVGLLPVYEPGEMAGQHGLLHDQIQAVLHAGNYKLHCKKRLAIFPSPTGMSLTKLSREY